MSDVRLGAGIDIEARMRAQQSEGRAPHREDLYTDKLTRFVFGLLRQLGLNFPFQYLFPPPSSVVVAREGVCFVPPGGYYDLTFKAPRNGYYVLECEIWPMCFLTASQLTVEHYFASSPNSPDHSTHPGAEAGIWKFRRIFLHNSRAYTTRLVNPNPFATLTVGFEYNEWEL